jgi:VIT1/CCC1 family predicted Fe2+/Mn2+ transporter
MKTKKDVEYRPSGDAACIDCYNKSLENEVFHYKNSLNNARTEAKQNMNGVFYSIGVLIFILIFYMAPTIAAIIILLIIGAGVLTLISK